MSLPLGRFLIFVVSTCLLGQAVAGLSCAEGPGVQLGQGKAAMPQQENGEAVYRIEAAYPFWRADFLPVDEIPFQYLDQIDHFSIHPGAQGTLVVPNGFVMPTLVEQAHLAGKRVILVVGGARDYGAFAAMAAEPSDRASFVRNLVDFLVEHGYDGVNIDWEFPQTLADRQNLSALMSELSAGLAAIDPELELSIAVTSNERRGQWIDVEAISPLVSHFLVMTFGYYGAWGSESGHNAPLYPVPAAGDSRCVDQSLSYWAEARGVPWSKIYMGIASFGLGFESEALYQALPDNPVVSKANYQDIKPLIGDGYTRQWDNAAQVPYLTLDDGPGVWSYDDPQSIDLKREYALANGIGGVAVWDVTMDRVGGEHELLKVLAHTSAPYRVLVPLVLRGK